MAGLGLQKIFEV